MTRTERFRHTLVVILTFGTGAVDAVGFLHLGGAFSSVMTGNMVLLGLSAPGGDWARTILVGIAIAGYIAGVVCGAHLAGRASATDRVWPARVTTALAVEGGLLVALSVVWLLTGPTRGDSLDEVMLAMSSLALGIQSSAVQRFGVSGLSSTYLTGTLTTVVAGFAARRAFRLQVPGLLILVALVVGAAAGFAVSAVAPVFVPVVLVGPIAFVVCAALLIAWDDDRILARPSGRSRAG